MMVPKQVRKILVVDDEEEVANYITRILKRASYEVITTTKGKEAVEIAKSRNPDLIILDIVMPDMYGSEVYDILSGDAAASTIPVIFLTGLGTRDDEGIIRGKKGDYHILSKPVIPEELLTSVNKVLA